MRPFSGFFRAAALTRTCFAFASALVAGGVGVAVSPRPVVAQDTTAKAPPPTKVKKGNSSLITQSEVESVMNVATNAYEVIEKIRPTMFRVRDASGMEVSVFLDDVRIGVFENLRSVPIAQIKEIRAISARDATTRWGTGYDNGALQVISKR